MTLKFSILMFEDWLFISSINHKPIRDKQSVSVIFVSLWYIAKQTICYEKKVTIIMLLLFIYFQCKNRCLNYVKTTQ